MTQALPGSEFGIDYDGWLDTFVFYKHVYGEDQVDRAVARFIRLVLKSKKLAKVPVVLWRGEYTNTTLGMTMWVLGVPTRGEQKVFDYLFNAIQEDGYSDHGAYQRIDTGCIPYLLVLNRTIWIFDPTVPYGESGSLQLGDSSFNVRFTRYVHQLSNRPASEDEKLRPFHQELSNLLEKWELNFTDSASENWPLVFPQFVDLLYWNVGDIEYHHLASICRDILKLPVFELPMEGHGRIVVRPRWVETEGSFEARDYPVVIAINRDLTPKMKLVALAHELAHYIFHYAYLQFFCQFSAMIQEQPGLETFIANRLDERWWEKYRNTTELRCDIITSLFLVPYQVDKMLEPVEAKTFSFERVTPDGQRLIWLQEHFDEEMQVGWGHVRQIAMEGLMSRLRARTGRYNPDWLLFDRLAYCVFNRENCMEELNDRESKINDDLTSILLETDRMEQMEAAHRGTTHLIRRVKRDEFEAELASGREFWDPVILDVPRQEEIIGYYPLTPAPYALNNSNDAWTCWVCPLKVPSMSLDEWKELLARERKGLMLYPLNPVEVHIRGKYLSRL